MDISLYATVGVAFLILLIVLGVVLYALLRYNAMSLRLWFLGLLMRLGDITYPWAKAFINARTDPPEAHQPEEYEILIALDRPSLHAKAFPAMMREMTRMPLYALKYSPGIFFLLAISLIALGFLPAWIVVLGTLLVLALLLPYVIFQSNRQLFWQYWARKWECEYTSYALFTNELVVEEARVPEDIFWGTGDLKRRLVTVSHTRTQDVKDTKIAPETSLIGLKGRPQTPFEKEFAQILAAARAQPVWLRNWLKLPENTVQIGTIPGRSLLEADVLDATEDPSGFLRALMAAKVLSARIQNLRDLSLRSGFEAAVGKIDDANWRPGDAPGKLNKMLMRLSFVATSGIVLVGPMEPKPIVLSEHPAGRFVKVRDLLAFSQGVVQTATSIENQLNQPPEVSDADADIGVL